MWIPEQWFQWKNHKWYPYYNNSGVVSNDGDEVLISFHANARGQVIFNMMNMLQKDQTVNVNLNVRKLGLPTTLYARDVVTDEVFKVINGKFQISIVSEKPRILLMDVKPVMESDLDFSSALPDTEKTKKKE